MTPILIAVLLSAVSTTGPVQLPTEVNGLPTIVHLANRSEVVTITAGPSGPLYTATTKAGKMLVQGATLEQLRDRHPDVYNRLHPAITVSNDDAPVLHAGM